jgi:catechol 2,3-dioxygenase-like lactoylglutathione lyase family enzyme
MNLDAINALQRPKGLPFRIGKIGHVALYVKDLERSARFYTEVLGFHVTEAIAPGRLPGGAVFLRCNTDHHGIALFQAIDEKQAGAGLHHIALEVATLDEIVRLRDHLRSHQVKIDLDGRRGAGVQIVVEFRDPDGHRLEIYWGIDQIGSEGKVRPPEQWKPVESLEAAIADPVAGQDTTLQDPALKDPALKDLAL